MLANSVQVLASLGQPQSSPSLGLGLLSVYNSQLLILFLEVVTQINSEGCWSYMRRSHSSLF